jgi:hypothetical protein
MMPFMLPPVGLWGRIGLQDGYLPHLQPFQIWNTCKQSIFPAWLISSWSLRILGKYWTHNFYLLECLPAALWFIWHHYSLKFLPYWKCCPVFQGHAVQLLVRSHTSLDILESEFAIPVSSAFFYSFTSGIISDFRQINNKCKINQSIYEFKELSWGPHSILWLLVCRMLKSNELTGELSDDMCKLTQLGYL